MSEFLDDEIKSKHLATLSQYHFDRTDFVETFNKVFTTDQIEEILSKCTCRVQTAYFAFLRDDDEFYIIHKDSGTIINWYKHLGRTNTCNKPEFELKDLEEFLQLIKKDLSR